MKEKEVMKLFNSLTNVNGGYIEEIRGKTGRSKKTVFVLKRSTFLIEAIAAACFILIFSITVYAKSVAPYNAAVGYLKALGIDAEDLSDYSRKEIKEAVEVFKTGGSNALTEKILKLKLKNEVKSTDEPTKVTSEQIRLLTPTMTRAEVLEVLGDTADIGSGIYIYVYEVDGQYTLTIPFTSYDAQLGVYGETLLEALTVKEK